MKIHIIGASGTGKSTLAKYISEQQGINWIDTDTYLWKDDRFKENRPIEERKEMYAKDMAVEDNYAASGSVFSWLPKGYNDRDLLVFLHLDEAVRMKRLRKREQQRGNRMWRDDRGQETNDFLEWCKTYTTARDKSSVGTYAEHAYQIELAASPVLQLDSSPPVEDLYKEIIKFYNRIQKSAEANTYEK